MSYSGSVINAPVQISDIQHVLGVSGGGDLATIIGQASINKWARYKPIVRPVIDTVTGQWDKNNNCWLTSANWWKGGDGHCGLTFSAFTEIGTLSNTNSFLYKLVHLLLPWTYTKPTGGSIAPYREQDFAQYFHDAVEPVGRLANAGGTIYAPASGAGTRTLSLNYDAPAAGDLNLTLSDFAHGGTSFTQFYLAVAMINGNRWIVASSVNKIGMTGSTVIETQIGYSDIGTWQIIPFLSSVNINAYGEQVVGTYISAGYDQLDTITIASSGSVYQIFASASWTNRAYTQLGVQCIIRNSNSAAKTFTGGVTFYIYETDDSATTGAGGTLKAQYTYSTSITVNANSDYTIPANQYSSLLDDYFVAFMNVTRATGKEYWVTARFVDGTTIDNEYEPVQDQIMPE